MIDFNKDYYQVLELDRYCSSEDVKSCYRILVKRYHPDLHPGNKEFEQKIRDINEAYEVLSNTDDKNIYDQYLQAQSKVSVADNKYSKNRKTYQRKDTVNVERKRFIKGKIYIKYHGDQLEDYTESVLRETFYKVKVTQVDAIILKEDIHEDLPHTFSTVFSQHKPFGLAIDQLIYCEVHDQTQISYYSLHIRDLTIPDVELIDVTKHEGDSFGTITGIFYGYVLKIEQEEVVTDVTECFGETGRAEERNENGVRMYRKEYFNSDCTTRWGEWVREKMRNTYVPTGHTEVKGNYVRYQYYRSNYKSTYYGKWIYRPQNASVNYGSGCIGPFSGLFGGVLSILLLVLFIPKLLFLLPFIIFAILLYVVPGHIWKWFAGLFYGILALAYVAALFNFIFNGHEHAKPEINEQRQARKPEETRFIRTTNVNERPIRRPDTIIRQTIEWKNYEDSLYAGTFILHNSDFIKSKRYKNQLPIYVTDEYSYDEMIFSLKEFDKDKLSGLYKMFDSLRTARKLDEFKFAEAIVSCVQSIPYTMVLPNSCTEAKYQDETVSRYLVSKDARCDGNERFGINTPVEFLASFSGDCDTRTLLLYAILDHYGFDVAVLSSEHYTHSILGINLPYDGLTYAYQDKQYVVWETTAPNVKPGMLPNEISNMNYWRISLKSK